MKIDLGFDVISFICKKVNLFTSLVLFGFFFFRQDTQDTSTGSVFYFLQLSQKSDWVQFDSIDEKCEAQPSLQVSFIFSSRSCSYSWDNENFLKNFPNRWYTKSE